MNGLPKLIKRERNTFVIYLRNKILIVSVSKRVVSTTYYLSFLFGILIMNDGDTYISVSGNTAILKIYGGESITVENF